MDEEDNDVEMIVRGDYYQKNGKHYVLYEELLEGFKEPVKNIIKITPTSMDITKKGTATTHMLFEKNRKNISCYSTPLGEMVVGIQANHFAVDEQADSLKVNVDYSLDINYEHMSDCLHFSRCAVLPVEREGAPHPRENPPHQNKKQPLPSGSRLFFYAPYYASLRNLAKNPFFFGGVGIEPPRTLLIWVM